MTYRGRKDRGIWECSQQNPEIIELSHHQITWFGDSNKLQKK